MIPRALFFAALLPLSALAQLQVFEFDGTNDTPVGTVVNLGAGETRFHVRNTGSAPAAIDTILLSGYDFAIQSEPSLPYTLPPYVGLASEAEIDIDFTPTIAASYSATLVVNTISIVLVSAPTAAVTLADGNTALNTGATVDFGSVAVGSTKTLGFFLSNLSPGNIDVGTLAVSGAYFAGPIGLSAPVSLTPGQTASFKVSFAPQSGTLAQGVLTVGTSTFKLTGQGLSQPLPSASIVFASDVGASAQQNSVSIPLASASQATGYGTLTLAFQSSVTGVVDDPAIQFLSGPLRKATVSIAVGDTSAEIGGQPSMAFQTGATAGTITFTLTLGNNAPQLSTLVILPSTISLDAFTAVRKYGALDVALSGFDNTYSASQLAFTFYDLKGLPLPQGAINVDAATTFQQYFATTQAGGMFALLATFPVTGNVTQIGFVSAQFTNSTGSTNAQQIPFGN